MPSTYIVQKLVQNQWLQPIDHTKIKNFDDLNPNLLNQTFDPNNEYSLPFIWGSTALAVNTEFIDANQITSWNDLWNPKYQGRVLILKGMRAAFAAALKSLGYSSNSTNPKEIKAAYERLKKTDPKVSQYATDTPMEAFYLVMCI